MMRTVHFMIATSVTLAIFSFSTCYAMTISIGFLVEHSHPPRTVYTFPGDSYTKFSLVTTGIGITEEDELITNWGLQSNKIEVFAKCVFSGYEHGSRYTTMFSTSDFGAQSTKVSSPTLFCQKGQGMKVVIKGAGNSNSNKHYEYRAILTMETDAVNEGTKQVSTTRTDLFDVDTKNSFGLAQSSSFY